MFCAAAFAGRALTVDPRRTRRYLYYYENAHFKTTSESQGHIDITSITSVEGLPPATKKEKSKQITIVTKVSCVFGRVAARTDGDASQFGRSFQLREPQDDARKADELLQRIDEWRKCVGPSIARCCAI